MPRIPLFRLPPKLRRHTRRRRLALLALLAVVVVVPLLLTLYCIYKPPHFLIGYLRARYPDVLFEEELPVPAASDASNANNNNNNDKIMALSIDDSPSAHTADILAALAESDAHATFFVIGAQVAGDDGAGAATLRGIVARGHELANHGMRDVRSTGLDLDVLEREAAQVREMLVAAYAAAAAAAAAEDENENDADNDNSSSSGRRGRGGRIPRTLPNNYYRPGSGFFTSAMRDRLGNRGYRITLGSIYPHDPQLRDPRRNARHILDMAHPGAIIICHDRRAWTAPMLRIVLPQLRARGYRIVTITDLVKAAEPLGGR